jgi:ATP adenylyltransferase/5',5'''-P-1,P-4-tetraphosphate phosphorylase II
MASDPLNEAALFQSFDEHVARHNVIYDAAQRVIPYTAGTFQVLFIITSAFDNKPEYGSSAASSDEGLVPGSDISFFGYEVCDIGTTHIVAFNKFAYIRPHLLLLTKDGYKRQNLALEETDVDALWTTLNRVDAKGSWMGIYNCGKDGGCSRVHRHMQLSPVPNKPDGTPFILFHDEGEGVARTLPFKYFLHRLSETSTAKEVFSSYVSLLAETKAILRSDMESCPHNVVLTKRWILVIPRKRGGIEALGFNSHGLMGIIALKSEEDHEKWMSLLSHIETTEQKANNL